MIPIATGLLCVRVGHQANLARALEEILNIFCTDIEVEVSNESNERGAGG